MHELMEPLPSGVWVYASKGDNSGEDAAWIVGRPGYRIVPRRRGNMAPSTLVETFALQRYRGRVETVKSQLAAWGVQRLHARTYEGWPCTLLASLFALLCVNAQQLPCPIGQCLVAASVLRVIALRGSEGSQEG